MMSCNFMNEGCHGGWGLFNGFFLENYYTTDEDCAPYKAVTNFGECPNYEHCPKVAKAGKTYYIGGHYGGMNELEMMKEVRANGPIYYDFMAGRPF